MNFSNKRLIDLVNAVTISNSKIILKDINGKNWFDEAKDVLKQNNEMDLIRAIWDAGFRVGLENGQDIATAFEYGSRSEAPSNPADAWDIDVKWRFEAIKPFDVENPKDWEDVP